VAFEVSKTEIVLQFHCKRWWLWHIITSTIWKLKASFMINIPDWHIDHISCYSWDSMVGIVIMLRSGKSGVQTMQWADFSLLQHIQIGSAVHPASYSMGTKSSFTSRKAAAVWGRTLDTIWCWS
jgi:hypothetical protein